MTKKTDSLIFRYGTQTLWKNTNFLFKTSISTSFFFKFLQFKLKKRNFELLSLEQKKYNLIYVCVFCFFWKNLPVKLIKKHVIFFFKFFMFYKNWFIFKVFYNIFYFLKVSFLTFFTLNYLFYFIHINYSKPKIIDYFYKHELQSLDTLLFKVDQLYLEKSLSFVFNLSFYIKVQNVFNLPIYFDFINIFKSQHSKKHNSSLTNLEFMLYLSCKLRMASIFSRYIAKSLELENKHRKVLWSVVNTINKLNLNLSLFKGIRIYVTGKLNGKMRRKTYSFKFGHINIQQICCNIDYFKSTSFTKFGTISVKVWLLFN